MICPHTCGVATVGVYGWVVVLRRRLRGTSTEGRCRVWRLCSEHGHVVRPTKPGCWRKERGIKRLGFGSWWLSTYAHHVRGVGRYIAGVGGGADQGLQGVRRSCGTLCEDGLVCVVSLRILSFCTKQSCTIAVAQAAVAQGRGEGRCWAAR